MNKTCSLPLCNLPFKARGYCSKHWEKWHRTGDPLYPTRRDPRPSIVKDGVTKIPIGVSAKDGYTVVDAAFAHLDKHKWSVHPSGYAVSDVDGQRVSLHQLVVGYYDKTKYVIDHINGDPKDNRRSNLRVCTQQQNIWNSRSKANTSSKYKGVGWNKQGKKWEAFINIDGKKKNLGLYKSEKTAANVYKYWANKTMGEYAYAERHSNG